MARRDLSHYPTSGVGLKLSPRARARRVAQRVVARTMDASGLNWLLHRWQVIANSPFIRIVNFHDTPRSLADHFERQLLFFKSRFVPVGRSELLDLLAGRWRHDRPGLLISFDDGLRSHADVAAPLLEKHGFVGWFFVPIEFLDTPREQQREYGREHRLLWSSAPGDEGGAMTWDDMRRLDKRHVIGGHTWTHVRLSDKLTAADLDREIRQSKARLEQELGHEVDAFCWVGGEEWSYSASAAAAIRGAGFRLGFMNAKSVIRPSTLPLQLHRICVEATDPMWHVRYLLSGLVDQFSAAQRKRVNTITAQ